MVLREKFPDGPVVRTQRFHCRGPSSIPGRGTKILQATQCSQKNKWFSYLEEVLKNRQNDLKCLNCHIQVEMFFKDLDPLISKDRAYDKSIKEYIPKKKKKKKKKK